MQKRNFLLCVIDVFSQYLLILPLKDKKSEIITKAFQKIVKESKHSPNKILVDNGNKFYNRSMKSWFESKIIEIFREAIKEN